MLIPTSLPTCPSLRVRASHVHQDQPISPQQEVGVAIPLPLRILRGESRDGTYLLSLVVQVAVAYVNIAMQQFGGFVARSSRQVGV